MKIQPKGIKNRIRWAFYHSLRFIGLRKLGDRLATEFVQRALKKYEAWCARQINP